MENDMFADLLSGLQPAAARQPTRDDIVSMDETRRKALSDTDEVPVDRCDTPVGENLRPPPPPLTKEEMQNLVQDKVGELLYQNIGALKNVLKAVLTGVTEKLGNLEVMCKETGEKLEAFRERHDRECTDVSDRLTRMEAALKESAVGMQRMLEKQDLVDAHVLLGRHTREQETEKSSTKDGRPEKEPEDPPTLPKKPINTEAEAHRPEKTEERQPAASYASTPMTVVMSPTPQQSHHVHPPMPTQQPPPMPSPPRPQHIPPTPVQNQMTPPVPPLPLPTGPVGQPMPPHVGVPMPTDYHPPPPGSQAFGNTYKPYSYPPPENGYQPMEKPPLPQQPPQPPPQQLPPYHTQGPPPPPPYNVPPPPSQQHPPPYPSYPTGPVRPPPPLPMRSAVPPPKSDVSRGTMSSQRASPMPPASHSMPLDQVINDVANMGFDRTKVRSVVTQLLDRGQNVDLNVVIDRLTSMGY